MTLLFADAPAFRTLLVDPPWSFDNYGQKGHGAARAAYKRTDDGDGLLSDEDLAAMPVARIAAEDAVCVLWCSTPALAEGRGAALLRAWGFRPVTALFVWNKIYPSGKPYCGLGHYTRSGSETALLGIAGEAPRAEEATAVLQVVTAPVVAQLVGEGEDERSVRHSSKPPEVHDRIERLWPELTPRVELFARRRRPGWLAWGNEAPQCDLVFGPEVGNTWQPKKVEAAPAAVELFQ